MKTRLALVAASLVAGIAAPLAMAGPVYDYPVVVSGRYMRGAMGTAHNSADTVQYLGCDLLAYADGTTIASCYGRTAAGVQGACSTSVPAHIQALASINSDSAIELTWDASNHCDRVTVRNNSWFDRK